jgi:aminopeptidase N
VAADIPDLQAVEVNFDGITYAKGASVLKQLVAYVGLEPFLAGLRSYFTAHAWGNATFADLLGALEQASGRDLSDWGEQWLRTTGLNMLRPSFDVDGDGLFTRFEVVQGGARPGAGELRTHRIAVGIYDDVEGRLQRTTRVEVDVTGERTPVPELLGVSRGKLVLANDDDLTYCALRLDPGSLVTLVDRIGDIAEPLPRTLCWSAAWEMTREAELKARDFTALVAGAWPPSRRSAWCSGCCCRPRRPWPPTPTRSGPRSGAGRCWSTRCASGSTPRCPARTPSWPSVNALAGCPLPQSVLTSFQGWLLDVACRRGSVVDTDLRWRILQALVANGAATEAEIDAEAQRDPHLHRPAQAERARALIPTAAAKERAWQRAVHDDDLPNAVQEAIIGGFSHPASGRSCCRTWSATSPRSPRCGRGARASGPSRWSSGCSRPGRWRSPRSTSPTAGSPRRATRPRCAGWCRRAGPGSCGRWPRGSSTAPSTRDRYLGPR